MSDIIKFAAKDLDIPYCVAENLVNMQDLIKDLKAISESWIWSDYGHTRLYVRLWSQNNIEPHIFLDKLYFDAVNNEWIFKSCFEEFILHSGVVFGKGNFSGAKTMEAFYEFVEAVCG